MQFPRWLLRLLPMWDYICPACKKEVKQKSGKCPHCGHVYGVPLRVPPKVLKDKKTLENYVHKHVFPKVSASQRGYLSQFFTTIFEDNFEGTFPSPWSGNSVSGFTQSFSTAQHHHNAKSLIQTGGNGSGEYAEIYKSVTAATSYYMRAYLKLDALGSGNVTTWLGPCVLSSGDANILGAGIRKEADGTRNWCVVNGGIASHIAYHASDSTINADEWYCLEIYCYVAAAPNGIAKLWVNGVLVVEQTGVTTNYHGNIARAAILTYTENGAYNTVDCSFYSDCAVVADAYVGVESEAPAGQPMVQVM